MALLQRPEAVSDADEARRLRAADGVNGLLARHAEAEKVDVLHDHHLVVVLDEHGVVQDVLHVSVVARGEVAQRLCDTLRGLLEPLAVHVLAELLQELRDQLFDHASPPS